MTWNPNADGHSKRGCVNVWMCGDCNHGTYAIHVHDGVTPMMLACRCQWCADCNGQAESWGYPANAPIPPSQARRIAWEWYRPDDREIVELERHVYVHVERGGLLLRELTDAGRQLIPEEYL